MDDCNTNGKNGNGIKEKIEHQSKLGEVAHDTLRRDIEYLEQNLKNEIDKLNEKCTVLANKLEDSNTTIHDKMDTANKDQDKVIDSRFKWSVVTMVAVVGLFVTVLASEFAYLTGYIHVVEERVRILEDDKFAIELVKGYLETTVKGK
ncbi:MAG: hypothetical protein OXC46_04305 [Thaumarchaeota archaeon]|nr:hypothetical protein [Nitrososphaerota archaeon]